MSARTRGPFEGRNDRAERERRLRREMEEELAFHLEMRERELVEKGTAGDAARDAARAQLGDFERTVEACLRSDVGRENEMEGREILNDLWRDVRLGIRQLRRRPTFALIAVGTLAIGIGANTAIFSVVDHVLLRPLPYAAPERALTLWEKDLSSGENRREVSPGNFVDWKERSTAFAAMGLAEPSGATYTGVVPFEAIRSWAVTDGWFEALGVDPILGRTFSAEEYQKGARSAAILSHRFWTERFGGDPGAIGRTIELDGAAVPIVGVLPPALDHPANKDLWTPKTWYLPQPGQQGYDERTDRESAYMLATARLADGVSREDAERDLARVSAELEAAHPETNRGVTVTAVPLSDKIVGNVRTPLWILMGTVAFVLLIACANVTSLLLARAADRARELQVRAALGAERGRLVFQLLVENLVLGGVGGAVGIGAAWLGVRLFTATMPAELPRAQEIALDGRVLLFTAGVTVLTSLLFGLLPAFRGGRSVGASGFRSTRTTAVGRLHGGLVVTQVALTLVLLIGAGLLGRSFLSLVATDVGFTTEGRVAIQLFLYDRQPEPAQRAEAVRRLEEEMRTVPGVEEVALTTSFPFHPEQIEGQSTFAVEGRTLEPGQRPSAYVTIASPDYFDVMGIPVLKGRGLTEDDRSDAPRVIVINETLAERFFPGEDPVGKRVTMGAMDRPVQREIVGVVGDVRPTSFESEPKAEAFVPFAQNLTGSVTLVVAVDRQSADVVSDLRAAVGRFDSQQPIYHANTVEELVRGKLAERRFNLIVLGALAGVALLLSAGGIYGVLSYATASRTSEIGIRMAMGAKSADVVGMIVREGLALTTLGVVIGLGAAAGLTRFMTAMLYGVEPIDPLTFLPVALLMSGVALVASWIPARRASRSDPSKALRE